MSQNAWAVCQMCSLACTFVQVLSYSGWQVFLWPASECGFPPLENAADALGRLHPRAYGSFPHVLFGTHCEQIGCNVVKGAWPKPVSLTYVEDFQESQRGPKASACCVRKNALR